MDKKNAMKRKKKRRERIYKYLNKDANFIKFKSKKSIVLFILIFYVTPPHC